MTEASWDRSIFIVLGGGFFGGLIFKIADIGYQEFVHRAKACCQRRSPSPRAGTYASVVGPLSGRCPVVPSHAAIVTEDRNTLPKTTVRYCQPTIQPHYPVGDAGHPMEPKNISLTSFMRAFVGVIVPSRRRDVGRCSDDSAYRSWYGGSELEHKS